MIDRLELPTGTPRAFALLAHCFPGGPETSAATHLARTLAQRGIGVLPVNFAESGPADDAASTGLGATIDDLVHAADHLRATYAAPTILIGHSLAGAAVLAAAHRIPEVRAVATIGAPADAEQVSHRIGGSSGNPDDPTATPADETAAVDLAGRTVRVRRQFLTDIAAQPQAARITSLRAALLVMHGPLDQAVGVDNARRIFVAARHPKSYVSLDAADHLLTNPDDATYAATVLAAWASRYAVGTSTESTDSAEQEGQVVVWESGTGPYGQHIHAGNHALTADEPKPTGGDTGPAPYDFLLAALGSCTSMTVRMYADRKQWPLNNVTVSLRHSRVHASDCANCETREGKVDRIDRVISFDGDLDEEQRERLMEIADKCPVHRTLHSEISIESTQARPNR